MLSDKIIDVTVKPDSSQEKLFFGTYGNFIRTDQCSHPMAKKLKEFSEGNVWFAKEVDYTNDRFDDLSDIQKRMFKLNIAYQTLMDSGVTNGYDSVITRIVTDPSWYLVFKRIGTEESIHAESYSYALNELMGTEEASRVLDLVYEDEFIQKRMASEVLDFSDVINQCLTYGLRDDLAKKAVLRMFIRTYLLESIKFPFSFLVTFAINNSSNSAIQGASRLIKLIAHDELFFHVPVGHTIMKILKQEPHQGFSYLFENGWFDNTVLQMMQETVDQEIEWAKYLLKDGDIPGLNLGISEHFIKYQAMTRLNTLGVKTNPYKEEKSDTITFFNTYKDINLQNTAMQEAENSAYQKGILKNDFPEGSWII